jgi:hypothetical protein
MKNLLFIIFALLTFSTCKAQSRGIVFTEKNFDTEFLNYQAIQKDGVSKENFDYAQVILSETKKALKNDIKNYHVTHYWNIATAFSTLMERNENIQVVFMKAVKSEGVCEYFESFEKVKNHFSKDIPDLYKREREKCLEKVGVLKIFDPIQYSNEFGLDLNLVQLIYEIHLDDQRYRKPYNESKQVELDKKNQKIIDSLYIKYKSYIGISMVGEKFSHVMWEVIQHSNIRMMEEYLPVIQKAVQNNELGKASFKMLIDRVCWEKYGYQIFGSQPGVKIADEKTRVEIIKKYGIE